MSQYVKEPAKKSQLVQFILALFGPVGLSYSSASAAWLLTILAVILGLLTFGIGALVVWGLSPIVGILAVSIYNAQVDNESRKHIEPMKAAGATNQIDLMIAQDSVKCPYCAEPIHKEASVCRYCNRDITPIGAPGGNDGTKSADVSNG